MADENFKQNKKDAEDYYKTQLNIAKVIKEITSDYTTYGAAVKKAKENAQAIREAEKEILRLSQIKTKEAQALLEKEKANLEYLKTYNKELLKTSNLLKSGFQSLTKSIGGSLAQGFTKILQNYNEMDKYARQSTIQVGMSVTRMNQFRKTAQQSAAELANLGMEAGAAGKMQQAFADQTGRQLMLTQKSIESMAALANTTGMSAEQMAGMVGSMDAVGKSSGSAVQVIDEIVKRTNSLGLNTSNVMEKVEKNIGLLNKLSFKSGVRGLAQMARYSEKYKLSMEAAAGFAEKVMRPEGAIDAAANLQVLGGSLAQMGDAFQLMGQARNNPEEFMKSITKAASETAKWDQATKEFKVSAYQMDRLREASEATGISVDELVQTAKQTAKINMFGDLVKIKGDDKEFLTSVMEMDSKGQAFVFDEKGSKQYLKNMTATEQQNLATTLKAEEDSARERAITMQTTQERVFNNLDRLLASFFPEIGKFDDSIRGTIEGFFDKAFEWLKQLKGSFSWVGKLIVGLMAFAAAAPILGTILGPIWSFAMGKWFAKGITSGMAQGKLTQQLMGGGQGGQGGVKYTKKGQPYITNESGTTRFIKKDQAAKMGQGGQSGVAQGASQTGDSAGKSATNMLKGAAAILILSAALFVFAKALQEFDKLQNGWSTLALAAASLLVLSGALFVVGKVVGQSATQMLLGSVAIAALGVALIPFAYAMSLLGGVGVGTMLGAALALGAFALAAFLMGGALVPILLGSVAIIALSGALMLFGLALQIVAPGMEMFLSSLSKLPSLIGPSLMFGPALLMMSGGIFALSASLLALGAAWWIGGSAFTSLTSSLASIQKIDSKGIYSAVNSINRLNTEKVEALKELASSLSWASMFGGGIKVEFDDVEVSGTINLKDSGGNVKKTILDDSQFITELKRKVFGAASKDKTSKYPKPK
jgi:hypothetical protein